MQLVERGFLLIEQRVILALQRQFVGHVREHEQQAAARVALARDAQHAPVGKRPQRLRQLRHFLIERQFASAPFGVIGVRWQLALLFQVIEPRGVAGMILQERRIEAPGLLERVVVEDEPLLCVEHRHALGEVVQRFIVSALLLGDLLLGRVGVGDVDGDAGGAAGDRVHQDAQRAQLAADDGAARLFNAFAGLDRLARQLDGALVKLQIALQRLIQRLGFERLQIDRVGPFELQRAVYAPRHKRRVLPHFQERGRVARDDLARFFDAPARAALFDATHAGVHDPRHRARRRCGRRLPRTRRLASKW